jgi:hypothetical protein
VGSVSTSVDELQAAAQRARVDKMALMVLVRAWRRQLLAASSAAVIVPGAMLGALIVLAFAGGFGRLGSLGQAFSGPSAPPARLTAGAPTGDHASAGNTSTATIGAAHVRTRAAPGVAAPGSAPPIVVSPRATRGEAGGASAQLSGGAAGAGGRGVAPGGHTPAPSGHTPAPGGGQAPAPGGPPPPGPGPRPTLTDQVVNAATSVTKQLPPPVGPATTQTLQSVGSVLDQAAPVPGPSRALHLRALPAS